MAESLGSPPQAWGQFTRDLAHIGAPRFTPTGVGTITPCGARATARAVHPHRRGDNRSPNTVTTRYSGSPPQAWGQLMQYVVATLYVRFTPTGVGTMPGMCRRRRYRAVHPHRRGDNQPYAGSTKSYNGSPPQAWGQFRPTLITTPHERFTPTGVGTIRSPPGCAACMMVHPHRRGDNYPAATAPLQPDGSPPQAWGQSLVGCAPEVDARFTPTGVGTIRGETLYVGSPTVHPHRRGDNAGDV